MQSTACVTVRFIDALARKKQVTPNYGPASAIVDGTLVSNRANGVDPLLQTISAWRNHFVRPAVRMHGERRVTRGWTTTTAMRATPRG
jgi:hypothetical protein